MGWPGLAVSYFTSSSTDQQDDRSPLLLGCTVLTEVADPGYASFAVIGAAHFRAFGCLFPPGLFMNQGKITAGFMERLKQVDDIVLMAWAAITTSVLTVHGCAGADPFLAEVYRRAGLLRMCREVTVANEVSCGWASCPPAAFPGTQLVTGSRIPCT